MRLPFFRAKPDAEPPRQAHPRNVRARPAPLDGGTADIERARTRARQRLAGAVVLLAVGVVGFPVLFETQPRPLPVDIPIRVGSGVGSDAAPGASATALKPLPVTALPPESGSEIVPGEVAASAPALAAGPASAPAAATPPAAATGASTPATAAVLTAGRTETAASQREAPTPATRADATVPAAPSAQAAGPRGDGARAAALLSGASSPAAAAGRFVVQVGAYTDPRMLKDTRAKVEKLGLQTYTQVVENDSGKRTRVRLGPYATRDEAEAAAARLKRAGLPANILAL